MSKKVSFNVPERNVYCVNYNQKSYHVLRKIKSLTKYRFGKLEDSANKFSCDQLIKECHKAFGEPFSFIHTGAWYDSEWGVLKAKGEICPHVSGDVSEL